MQISLCLREAGFGLRFSPLPRPPFLLRSPIMAMQSVSRWTRLRQKSPHPAARSESEPITPPNITFSTVANALPPWLWVGAPSSPAHLTVTVNAFAIDTKAIQYVLHPTEGLAHGFRLRVHREAKQRGWLSQSFGLPAFRVLVLLKPEYLNAPCRPEAGGRPSSVGVHFSGIQLDLGSSRQLTAALQPHIPPGWTVYCDHMTICQRPLVSYNQQGGRLNEDVRLRLGKLRLGQGVALQVVMVGRSTSALAVGVMGCPSCNMSPHVTVAVAPFHKAMESNQIAEWQPYCGPPLVLNGKVKEFLRI